MGLERRQRGAGRGALEVVDDVKGVVFRGSRGGAGVELMDPRC